MLGDNIRKLMGQRTMLAKDLANLVGITPTYLSYILNNKRNNPATEVVQKIADALQVPIGLLYSDESIIQSIIDKFYLENPNTAQALKYKDGKLIEDKTMPILREFVRDYPNIYDKLSEEAKREILQKDIEFRSMKSSANIDNDEVDEDIKVIARGMQKMKEEKPENFDLVKRLLKTMSDKADDELNK